MDVLSLEQILQKIWKKEFHTEDGKILCDISDKKSIDRMAILLFVSGVDGMERALYVKAMCFDTPLVNIGKVNLIHKGTCVRFYVLPIYLLKIS